MKNEGKIKGLKDYSFSFSQPVSDYQNKFFKKDVAFIKKNFLERMFIRKRNILFIESCRYAKIAAQKRWGIDFAFLDYGKRGLLKQVFQTNNLNRDAAKLWWKEIKDDPKFADKLVRDLENIIKIDKKISQAEFLKKKTWNSNELIEILNLYLNWFSQFFEIVYPWFAIDEMKENILEPWIKKKYKNKANEIIEKIFKPTNLPLSSIEQLDFLKIYSAKGIRRGVLMKKHKKKYDFLAVHQLEDRPFDLNYYQSRIKNIKKSEYSEVKNNLKKAKSEITEANKLQATLKFPEKYDALLSLIRSFAYLRTNSIDHMMMAYKTFQKPLTKIAQKLGINLEELTFLTFYEIENGLKNKIDLKEKARKRMQNGYLYLIGSQASYLFQDRKGVEIFRSFEKFTDVYKSDRKKITGTSAFPGKATGKARVIFDRRLAGELKKGEILVTTMTSPDFVPAMKRAKAIVTNEGGILCHAAIMARELRKTCIIGTKIATDVIKTGDLVEVDANNGIVKIIKKIR